MQQQEYSRTTEGIALELRKEAINLGILVVIAAAITKIAFHQQDIATTTRTVLAWFWMLTLPGYALLLYWREKLEFAERVVVGTAAAAAFTSVASYYLGLFGVHVRWHGIILPAVMLGIAAIANKKLLSHLLNRKGKQEQ